MPAGQIPKKDFCMKNETNREIAPHLMKTVQIEGERRRHGREKKRREKATDDVLLPRPLQQKERTQDFIKGEVLLPRLPHRKEEEAGQRVQDSG